MPLTVTVDMLQGTLKELTKELNKQFAKEVATLNQTMARLEQRIASLETKKS
jgi:hypothetical protein